MIIKKDRHLFLSSTNLHDETGLRGSEGRRSQGGGGWTTSSPLPFLVKNGPSLSSGSSFSRMGRFLYWKGKERRRGEGQRTEKEEKRTTKEEGN